MVEAGFDNVVVQGFQRYPLANHMYWLEQGKPGGQNAWSFLQDEPTDSSYANLLEKLGATDTLIAVAAVT